MNRRRFLIALAILVPLALFGAAKWASRWRPVRVGAMVGAPKNPAPTLRVTERAVLACHNYGVCTRFDLTADLNAAARRKVRRQTVARDGTWTAALVSRPNAELQPALTPKLELALTRDGATRAYPIPNLTITTGEAGFEARALNERTLRVSPELNRVEMVLFTSYYRWNLATRALERRTALPMVGFGSVNGFIEENVVALARDGESVCLLNSHFIEWRSARDGRTLRRFPVRGMRPTNVTSDQIQVSTFGALALLNVPVKGVNSKRWQVVNARTGAALWRFDLDALSARAVIAPDETVLALPRARDWQIRDAHTGAILRTLPLVPDANAAAFSPDGATLYSIANGILYRQRAR